MNTVFDRKPMKTTLERFREKYYPTSSCWFWKGHITRDGYGWFRFDGGTKAHRFSYQYFNGAIPKGLTIDHLCRIRHCVNPFHLRAIKNKENVLAGIAPTKKTKCKRGHDLVSANVQIYRGSRHCRRIRNAK